MSIYRVNSRIIGKLNGYSLGGVSLLIIGLLGVMLLMVNISLYFTNRELPMEEQLSIEKPCRDQLWKMTGRASHVICDPTSRIEMNGYMVICYCPR